MTALGGATFVARNQRPAGSLTWTTRSPATASYDSKCLACHAASADPRLRNHARLQPAAVPPATCPKPNCPAATWHFPTTRSVSSVPATPTRTDPKIISETNSALRCSLSLARVCVKAQTPSPRNFGLSPEENLCSLCLFLKPAPSADHLDSRSFLSLSLCLPDSGPKPHTRSPRSLSDLRGSPETKSPRPLFFLTPAPERRVPRPSNRPF